MQRTCDACGKTYEARRSTSRYCSSLCRTRVSRAGAGKPRLAAVPTAKSAPEPPKAGQDAPETATFLGSLRAELENAHRLDTVQGQQALVLAELMLSPLSTGAMVASLSREFRAVLAAALEGANAEDDPVVLLQQEWRARLEQRRLSG